MKKFFVVISFLLSSCMHQNPPSEAAIAAGMAAHAGVHNDYRKKNEAYTQYEENTAKITGDFVASRWDIYQKDNKTPPTLKDGQLILNASHIQINKSFPKDKKPFVIK